MSVGTVVLNWNNYEDTSDCIESLREQQYGQNTIYIVDNGSEDGSRERLKEDYPECEHIYIEENSGFPTGNNHGIKSAINDGHDFIFILNNDTLLPNNNLITSLIETANEEENVGIVSPLIVHYPKTNKIWFAKGTISSFLGENIHKYRGEIRSDTFLPEIIENDRVTGCAMFIPAKIFDDVGLFNSKYFLLESDTEFSLRVKRSGYRLLTDTRITLYHKVSNSSGPRFNLSYYSARNRWLLIKSNPEFRVTAYLFYIGGIIRAIYRRTITSNTSYISDLIKGMLDGIRGKTGKR